MYRYRCINSFFISKEYQIFLRGIFKEETRRAGNGFRIWQAPTIEFEEVMTGNIITLGNRPLSVELQIGDTFLLKSDLGKILVKIQEKYINEDGDIYYTVTKKSIIDNRKESNQIYLKILSMIEIYKEGITFEPEERGKIIDNFNKLLFDFNSMEEQIESSNEEDNIKDYLPFEKLVTNKGKETCVVKNSFGEVIEEFNQ